MKARGQSESQRPARRTTPPPAQSGSHPAAAVAPAATGSGHRRAAPWVMRHAAKHAEETRQRNAAPAPPGSARATLRVPERAESIKEGIGTLHGLLSRVRQLKKNLNTHYYEIGVLLHQIRQERLYEFKGYASFEAFCERELDFGKATAAHLTELPALFLPEAAKAHGMNALFAAVDALERAAEAVPPARLPSKPPRARR